MTRQEQAEREQEMKSLRELLPPGSVVYTSVAHVSRSGMQREIKVYAMVDNQPQWISYAVAKVLRNRLGKRDGVIMGGCGMDMGFALVYELSYNLYPQGFECIGQGCPANDHVNGDRDYSPHMHPQAGGYALKQRWL